MAKLELVPELLRLVDVGRACGHVALLASAACAGRAPGSAGEQRAAEYLADRLQAIGWPPLAEVGAHRDPFSLTVSELAGEPTLALAEAPATAFVHLRDFCVDVQGAAGSGRARGETVWLGAMAAEDGLPDALRGRVGVCWSTPPVSGDQLRAAFEAYLQRVRRARDAGASALLQIAPRVDRRKVMAHCHETPELPVLDVDPAIGRALFAPYPPPAVGQRGRSVELRVELERREVYSAGNVMAGLGPHPIGAVVCAHYDHLGTLPDGRHFPGAADNASGVAVALEAAAAIAAAGDRLRRRLVLLFSAAEETGMFGARRFVERFG
ncbi:MAG: M20/M25/M40 family metallo-hydrolase, partial [Deltaproteobacteria bacterium]|nr:M20/M25/M40 family metallo-hydrolase [Deltaproteobacteria bacterium]